MEKCRKVSGIEHRLGYSQSSSFDACIFSASGGQADHHEYLDLRFEQIKTFAAESEAVYRKFVEFVKILLGKGWGNISNNLQRV